MNNIRSYYRLDEAAEELHCSPGLIRHLFEEGKIRFAYDLHNSFIPIELIDFSKVPECNLPITHEYAGHVYSAKDRFLYTHPSSALDYGKKDGFIVISSSVDFLETFEGRLVNAVVEIEDGYAYPQLKIPYENPIITTYEIERYKNKISEEGPLNIGESSDLAAVLIVYFGNLYFLEFERVPTAKRLIKYIEAHNLREDLFRIIVDEEKPYYINDIPMNLDSLKKRLINYKKFGSNKGK